MKVFISWSGERSQALAQALRGWLPLVLHYVEPWLSEADVSAGERWAQTVTKELEASNFGVICVTPENLGSPWILFEAGALAKSMQGSRVIPLLLNLEFSDLTGPLAQFQAKKVERTGLSEVIMSINEAADQAIPEPRAQQLFEALWPEFEKQATSIPEEAPSERHMRPQHEILEELVTGVRAFDSRFQELENAVSKQAPRLSRFKRRHLHPMLFEEMADMTSDETDDPIVFLIFAGLLRDDFPWLYEVMMDVYRELRSGDSKSARRAIERFRLVNKTIGRSALMEEFAGSSRETHMMMLEIPMVFDRLLHRYEKRRQLSVLKEKSKEAEESSE